MLSLCGTTLSMSFKCKPAWRCLVDIFFWKMIRRNSENKHGKKKKDFLRFLFKFITKYQKRNMNRLHYSPQWKETHTEKLKIKLKKNELRKKKQASRRAIVLIFYCTQKKRRRLKRWKKIIIINDDAFG